MPEFKTGRLPAVRPAAVADLAVYAKGRIPRPPASVSVPAVPYPIDRNDIEGDCTIAGVDHLLRGWNAQYPLEQVVPPSEEEIGRTYRTLSGGEDTGLVEASVLRTWMLDGLFGTKIAGYAPIDPRNLLTIHQSIAFYGGAYLGILCPRSAQLQFAKGEPWTYCGEETRDGHCVVALGYDRHGDLIVATWGGLATLTAGFLAHYLEEAWCVLGPQVVAAKEDTLGLDLDALKADLARI